jgi:hypothetical protein
MQSGLSRGPGSTCWGTFVKVIIAEGKDENFSQWTVWVQSPLNE